MSVNKNRTTQAFMIPDNGTLFYSENFSEYEFKSVEGELIFIKGCKQGDLRKNQLAILEPTREVIPEWEQVDDAVKHEYWTLVKE